MAPPGVVPPGGAVWAHPGAGTPSVPRMAVTARGAAPRRESHECQDIRTEWCNAAASGEAAVRGAGTTGEAPGSQAARPAGRNHRPSTRVD